MAELNMYPTRSFVRIKATYTNRILSGGVSYAPLRHFVLLKKYIVYGQGPIACYRQFCIWRFFCPSVYMSPITTNLITYRPEKGDYYSGTSLPCFFKYMI